MSRPKKSPEEKADDGQPDKNGSNDSGGTLSPCALESAPDGAKCIVSRTDAGKAVRLLTPAGAETLAGDDLFYTLPAGAKVKKMTGTRYLVYRLGVQEAPICECPSAREAVVQFLKIVA